VCALSCGIARADDDLVAPADEAFGQMLADGTCAEDRDVHALPPEVHPSSEPW
jgi:hypothetical protein